MRSYRHEESEVFGCSQGCDPKSSRTCLRQAVIEGYLERGIENYGILRLTAKGRKFLDKPVSFKIVEDTDFSDDIPDEDAIMKSGSSCAADPELFAILNGLRKSVAAGAEPAAIRHISKIHRWRLWRHTCYHQLRRTCHKDTRRRKQANATAMSS